MKRESIHNYFLRIAEVVASRSTCDRKMVGAVIVKDGMILSTGFNGSMRKFPHCDDAGHVIENGHCTRTVHAEMNSIAQAARHGTSIDGSAMYVTASPCRNCFKVIVNSGVEKIYFREFYRDEWVLSAATLAGVLMRRVDSSGVEWDVHYDPIQGTFHERKTYEP